LDRVSTGSGSDLVVSHWPGRYRSLYWPDPSTRLISKNSRTAVGHSQYHLR